MRRLADTALTTLDAFTRKHLKAWMENAFGINEDTDDDYGDFVEWLEDGNFDGNSSWTTLYRRFEGGA